MKHDSEGSERLQADAARLGVALSVRQAGQLLDFESMLRDRGTELGLVGAGDARRIRERHVLDSLRAMAALLDADHDVYDLGSGAGLPGIVVAIAEPRLRIGLIEAKRRRVAFLEQVVEETGLENAEVIHARIQEVERSVDVCFARALAPAARAWEMAERLLRPSGRLVYFAGDRFNTSDLRTTASVRLLEEPSEWFVLESSGPLVIMAK